MRLSNMRHMLAVAVTIMFIVSCGNEQQVTPPGPRVARPLASTNDAKVSSVSPSSPLEGVNGNIIDATYDLSIKAGFLTVCNGRLTIKVNVGIGTGSGGLPFQMPDSCLSCLGAKIDVSKFLQTMGGSVGSAPPMPTNPADMIHIQDGVIGVKDMGGVVFAPGRPLLPSFLALKPEELRNLRATWNTTLQNTKSGETGSGTFMGSVTQSGPYQSPGMSYDFKNTISFETTYSGFDSIKMKSQNMLLDKMGMVISLDPLAFPRIFAEINAGKMRSEMGQSGQSIDLDKLESAQCGANSGFTKFMMGILNDPSKLQAIQGPMSSGPMAAIGKILMDIIINKTTIVISGDLAKMEGLDK